MRKHLFRFDDKTQEIPNQVRNDGVDGCECICFRFIGYEIPNQVRNDGVDRCDSICLGLTSRWRGLRRIWRGEACFYEVKIPTARVARNSRFCERNFVQKNIILRKQKNGKKTRCNYWNGSYYSSWK